MAEHGDETLEATATGISTGASGSARRVEPSALGSSGSGAQAYDLKRFCGRVAPLVVLGTAICLTLLRFADLGTAPFINDEPALQLMLDQHAAAHTLPTHGLEGSRGLAYGPTALWLYAPVRLLTDNVTCIIGWHAFLQCAGLVVLFLAVRACAGPATASWTWLLLAASPYLFFYARLGWDNTLLVPLVALVLFLLVRLERHPQRATLWFALCVVCALIFDLHLMALPAIAAAFIIAAPFAWRSRRSRAMWVGVLSGALAAAVIAGLYLRDVAGSLMHGSQVAATTRGLTTVVPETLQEMRRYLSGEGMDYFFDQTSAPILKMLGPFARGFDLTWIVAFAALGCFLAMTWTMILAAIRRTSSQAAPPIVVRFAVLFVWVFLAYYYALRPDPFHPHYVMVSCWVVPLLAAWSLERLRGATLSVTPLPAAPSAGGPWRRLPRAPLLRALQRGLQAVMVILVVSDVAFVLAAHAQIVRNHGTRANHYGSTQAEIRTATDEICRDTRAVNRKLAFVDLRRVPGVLPMSFTWFDHHLRDCAGVDLAFWGVPRRSVDPVFSVVYGDATPYDARLRILGP